MAQIIPLLGGDFVVSSVERFRGG